VPTGLFFNSVKGISIRNRIAKIVAFVLIFAVFIANIVIIPLSDGFYNQAANDIWVVNCIIVYLVDVIITDTLRSWATVFFL
jgi:hypothetical protein